MGRVRRFAEFAAFSLSGALWPTRSPVLDSTCQTGGIPRRRSGYRGSVQRDEHFLAQHVRLAHGAMRAETRDGTRHRTVFPAPPREPCVHRAPACARRGESRLRTRSRDASEPMRRRVLGFRHGARRSHLSRFLQIPAWRALRGIRRLFDAIGRLRPPVLSVNWRARLEWVGRWATFDGRSPG